MMITFSQYGKLSKQFILNYKNKLKPELITKNKNLDFKVEIAQRSKSITLPIHIKFTKIDDECCVYYNLSKQRTNCRHIIS